MSSVKGTPGSWLRRVAAPLGARRSSRLMVKCPGAGVSMVGTLLNVAQCTPESSAVAVLHRPVNSVSRILPASSPCPVRRAARAGRLLLQLDRPGVVALSRWLVGGGDSFFDGKLDDRILRDPSIQRRPDPGRQSRPDIRTSTLNCRGAADRLELASLDLLLDILRLLLGGGTAELNRAGLDRGEPNADEPDEEGSAAEGQQRCHHRRRGVLDGDNAVRRQLRCAPLYRLFAVRRPHVGQQRRQQENPSNDERDDTLD
jgi:hypothetical protein